MKLIVPNAVTDTTLVESNVVETATLWSGATTYALGNQVGVATGVGNVINVYESLQNSNLNKAPASNPAWWKFVSITYGAYSGATTYAKGDRVINVAANVHQVYQSAVASNVGQALTDTSKWAYVGATNKLAAFDRSNTSQTIRQGNITVGLKPGTRFNAVAALNLKGTSVSLTLTDPVDGVVYSATKSLVSDSGIDNWYSWLFTDIEYVDQAIFDELPNYLNATARVQVNGSGEVAAGVIATGYAREIGDEQYGASVGIIDYSYKSADEWGNYQIVERAFSKTGNFTVFVKAKFVDVLQGLLSKYRATPIIYYVSPLYASTVIYGFYKNAKVTIDYWNYSVLSIDIEGLT